MKILHLTLKKKWFDMIASGEKKEEYREIKSYWNQRLNKKYDFVVFRNGYSKDSPQLVVELKEIMTGPGRTKWGAPESKPVYILKLGEIFSMPKTATKTAKTEKIRHEGCEKCEFYNKELDSCTDIEEYIIYVCRHQPGQ